MKSSNYSQEETEAIVAAYEANPTKETVEALAEQYERSTKSIIGKLSREGVYRRVAYVTKTGELPITKPELVAEIAYLLDAEPEVVEGLEKSPKQTLLRLLKHLKQPSPQ